MMPGAKPRLSCAEQNSPRAAVALPSSAISFGMTLVMAIARALVTRGFLGTCATHSLEPGEVLLLFPEKRSADEEVNGQWQGT
jgi:hypothetical protein